MAAVVLLGVLLASGPAAELRHFRPAEKSLVPAALIEELCPDPERKACWQFFEETGKAWVGDVSNDGEAELLIFPGRAFVGSGGLSLFLYQRRGEQWISLIEEEGWLIRGIRVDILPIVRRGYSDLRLGADLCWKWNGAQYVAYEPEDYRQLSPAWFDASDLREAEIFWRLRYGGLKKFNFEPQWFPGVPKGSVNSTLDDAELGWRWVAMFKGGVYGARGEESFLLLPQPDYLGAGRLELEGDWLLIYGPGDPPDLLARYNRRTRELRIEMEE
ncbi:MAG: hypothetical protein HY656_00345 [Acidobacteria bacterium]|nr:hypothetical protein [Acidobacteriota bacterium]